MPQRMLFTDDEGQRDNPLTVSALTAEIKSLLESRFPSIWVEGEISNFSRPRSGHCYLTLKDAGAQLPAVMWRSTASRLRFDPQDGLQVVCRGKVDVYPPHGKYQLVIDQIEPKGLGALELAFRQLHDRLAKEGLFAPELKRLLPPRIRRVCVITSATGAAIRDFLQVLSRRWRAIDVQIIPVRVQGEGAAREIAQAIAMANHLADPPDCLVVTRGGGSLEDLWAFNEEVVVRAIRASTIPVVSGVGHEIDVTLSDLAADVRALTPSEAAERISPDQREVEAHLTRLASRLSNATAVRMHEARRRLEQLASARLMRNPFELIRDRSRRVDDLDMRSRRAVRRQAAHEKQRLSSLAARLESLSPLSVLQRGYSLTHDEQGHTVYDADTVKVGQMIRTRLARGELISRVTDIVSSDESQG